LEARLKGSADFKPVWRLMAETKRFMLKFTAVEMRLCYDVKPRICERLCVCKIKTKVLKLMFQGTLTTAEITVIISNAYSSRKSRTGRLAMGWTNQDSNPSRSK
jgi:hypothetical protein